MTLVRYELGVTMRFCCVVSLAAFFWFYVDSFRALHDPRRDSDRSRSDARLAHDAGPLIW